MTEEIFIDQAETLQATVAEAWAEVVALVTAYGLSVLGAVVLLIVGLWLSGWARRATLASLAHVHRVDATLRSFFGNAVRYAIVALTVIMVLNQFGVQTASLVAVLGAAGLAIGLALQGTLSNVAAGVMLLLFRPLSVGDFVSAGGAVGTVREVNLFTTEIATPDNVRVIVPNGAIWGANVVNYSAYADRRIEIVTAIGPGASIDGAMAALRAVWQADARVRSLPPPAIYVTSLAAAGTELTIHLWCAAADVWGLRTDMLKRFRETLDEAGIAPPAPAAAPVRPAAGA